MPYYSTGLLASLVLLIINHDIFWQKEGDHTVPAREPYRRFLLSVLAYYITDALWGVLDIIRLTVWQFADTTVHFAAIALAVLFWTRFVVAYLEGQDRLRKILSYLGWIFLVFEMALTVLNLFFPVLFRFDRNGDYHSFAARDASLYIQITMFLLTAIFALAISLRSRGAVRRRYFVIGLFALAMVLLLSVQVLYPLLPFYSIGYLLGTCLLHTFVFEDEKEEFRKELIDSVRREQQRQLELRSARQLAYRDPLTGVKSKHAYTEAVAGIDTRIETGGLESFSVAVFDLNGLKTVNDMQGHDAGDRYIVSACRMICDYFKHSPVFRIGGDEFAAILEGEDYLNRAQIAEEFNRKIDGNQKKGDNVVVSLGIAEYRRGEDENYQAVFDRADQIMYERKRELKKTDNM